MAHSLQVEIGKIRQSQSRPAFVQDARHQRFADDRDHFEVDYLGSDKVLTLQALAGTVAVYIVVCERRCDDRRVNDNQPAFRSSRTASLAKRNDT